MIGKLPIDKKTREYIRGALSEVASDGTAARRLRRLPDGQASASAARPVRPRSTARPDTSWFASFAPTKNPRFVVVVMVSQGGMGGSAAAPAVRQIYEGIYGLTGKPPALPAGHPAERLPVIGPDGTVKR